MTITFNEKHERTGAILNTDEALILVILSGKLSRDQLQSYGFTEVECERIENWSEDYVR